MPIYHNVVQGSEAWLRARMGKPTASCFHRILTPKERKPSKQAEGYRMELLTELVLGRPLENPLTAAMSRGIAMETEAADFYSFQTNQDLEAVGFVESDCHRFGASPDRLCGSDGLVQIKVPLASTHLGYLLHPERGVDAEYFCQVQGEMFVTERLWCDVISYHPEMPSVIVRVERDKEFIKLLAEQLEIFCAELAKGKAELEARGLIRDEPEEDPFFISDADVDAILAARQQVTGRGTHEIST